MPAKNDGIMDFEVAESIVNKVLGEVTKLVHDYVNKMRKNPKPDDYIICTQIVILSFNAMLGRKTIEIVQKMREKDLDKLHTN